jgi:hypothetical protein
VGPDDVRAHVLQVRLQSTARAASYTMRTHALRATRETRRRAVAPA